MENMFFSSDYDPSSLMKSIMKLLKWRRVPTKYFNTLQLELQFLKTFLERCFEYHNFLTKKEKEGYHNVKDLLMRATGHVDKKAQFDLEVLVKMGTSKRPDDEMMVTKFIDMVAYVVDEVKLMRSQIREVHKIMWRTSPPHNRMSYDLVIKFIDSLLDNLKVLIRLKVDLVDPLKIDLEALEEKLRFEYRNLKDLLMRAKAADDLLMRATGADEKAEFDLKDVVEMGTSKGPDEEMMATKLINMAACVVDEVKLMKSQIRQVHRKLWWRLRYDDHMGGDLVIKFIYSLLENLKDLISFKVDLVDPLKRKLESLEEKLRVDHNLKDLVMLAKAADDLLVYIIDVGEPGNLDLKDVAEMCKKQRRPDAEMIVNEVNNMAADMPDKVKLIRSEIREVHKIILWRALSSHNHLSYELVIKIIDSHLDNLKDLISFKVDLVDPLKIKLKALEEKLRFEYHNLKDLLMHAKAVDDLLMRATAVDKRAEFDLKDVVEMGTSKGPDEEMMATKFINMAAYVVDEVKLMRSEIKEVHKIMWRTSPSHNRVRHDLVIKFIDSLLENLKDLISFKVDLVDPLKIKLEALEEKLRFLRTFLMFTKTRCQNYVKLNDLFTHAKVVADNAAYLSYSCLVDEMDEDMLHTLVSDLSDLVQKIGPVTPEVRQIYISVLKASSDKFTFPSPTPCNGDEIAVDFVWSRS